jgi:DNA invertase Pin-like site-specific DNA recombinase
VSGAGIYVRISRDPTGHELGVRRQEDDCRALADRNGWPVVEVFVDDDRSAYSGKPRPAYDRMLAGLDDGTLDVVIAWHPDRLHRRPVELEAFIDLIEKTGAKVVTVQAGEYDLATPSGRMAARIVGAVARHESEHKSARLRRKHLELAQAGKVSGGGSRPFGYAADRVTIVDAEAALIREAVARFLAGESLRSLAAGWTERQVPTSTGAKWSTPVLRRLLGSARIAGLRDHDGTITPAVWPAIISADDHRRVRALLDDPARIRRRPGRRYLLSGGTAVCGLCDAALVARPKDDGRRCYVCSSGVGFHGCGKIRCLADPLEEMAVGAVIERVDHLGLLAAAPPPAHQPRRNVDDVIELERKLGELGEMWAAGEIDRAGWRAANETLTSRLRAARSAEADQIRTVGPVEEWQGRGGALAAVWDELSLDQQRAIVAAVIDRVVVGPAVRGRNRFDAGRVDLQLRV